MELKQGVKTQMLAADTIIPLDDFTQLYIGNILKATVTSLGHSGEKIRFKFENQTLEISADSTDVPINSELERNLVESTIKGMLSTLRGITWFGKVIIISSG